MGVGKSKRGKLTYARMASQGGFLLLFLYLFIETQSTGQDTLGPPVRLFLDFDPLILLSTLLSAHAAPVAFYLSLVLIVITLVLGRVFCGWACPLGTLNNMTAALRRRTAEHDWHRLKYLILVFLLASSVFTLQLAGLLDPISLLIRSLALSIYPALNHSAGAVADSLYEYGPAPSVTDAAYLWFKGAFLSFNDPRYRQSILIGALFLLVIGLNLHERRLWCRHLCPLGAMLGLLSGRSLLRRSVSEGCTGCGACSTMCQGAAAPDKKENWRQEECYYCMNCDDACPEGAVSFGFRGERKHAPLDLGRRRVLGTALAGIASVPLLRVSEASGVTDPLLIRPPGSLAEREFLRRCVRCGECMKVCITGGLQPAMLEAGPEGLWTPVLVPRLGYCEYNCTLCGQVCPTGAIKELERDRKVKVHIGTAMIDKGRCLPWAHGRPCIVCEEMCPTPKKAIWFDEADVRQRDGSTVKLKQPVVDLELCIGCGICETQCPVLDRPAIYVTSAGEGRSDRNRILL